MPRVNIFFTMEVFEDLKQFIIDKHGAKKAMSLTVEQAVREYLERQRLLKQLSR